MKFNNSRTAFIYGNYGTNGFYLNLIILESFF